MFDIPRIKFLSTTPTSGKLAIYGWALTKLILVKILKRTAIKADDNPSGDQHNESCFTMNPIQDRYQIS